MFESPHSDQDWRVRGPVDGLSGGVLDPALPMALIDVVLFGEDRDDLPSLALCALVDRRPSDKVPADIGRHRSFLELAVTMKVDRVTAHAVTFVRRSQIRCAG